MELDYNYSVESPPTTLILCIPQEKKYFFNDICFNDINELYNYIRNNP